MMKTVTRFAPSPTGLLHMGHAYSALFAHSAARNEQGQFILRIEDIDRTRCKPEFEAAIIEDLSWLGRDLGLVWDGTVRRQSDHFDDYQVALNRLQEMGLIYPCFCSRKEISAEIARSAHAPHGPDGYLYPGTCRAMASAERANKIAAGSPYVMRLDIARATDQASARTGPLTWHDRGAGDVLARPEVLGDVVLARKDTPTSYHLSVTVDDHLQDITLVTRGVDLFHATHVHRLLQALLEYNVPEYHHHPLLKGADGKRFSKRDKSLTLAALRLRGHTPADVQAMIAGLLKG